MSEVDAPAVRKLFQLREWLTLDDASSHLSRLIGESVLPRDLLRLVLDRHLTLSVHLVNHATVRCGRLVAPEQARRYEMPIKPGDFPNLEIPEEGAVFRGVSGLVMPDGRVLELEDAVRSVDGIWDLAMVGAERLDVEHRYQSMSGGPAVDLVCLEGAILSRPDGTYSQVQEHFDKNEFADRARNATDAWNHIRNFYPAGSLPDGAVWVVRMTELEKTASEINAAVVQTGAAPEVRPIERRERSTLWTVIAGLVDLAKLDLRHPSKAAASIESATVRLGSRVAARTIEEHLKRIPDALDGRAG